MKTLALTAAAALLLAACAKHSPSTADQMRDALPSSDALKIDAPDTTKSTTLAPETRAAVQTSGLAGASYAFAASLDGGVYAILFLLHRVTLSPPTSCAAGVSCTWGPGLGDDGLNLFRLVVAVNANGGYDYALSGAPVSTGGKAWVDLVAGTAYPGDPGRGSGTFTVGFDAAAAGLDHPAGFVQQDFGTLRVRYDARQGLAIECAFMDARNADDPGTDPANPNRVDAYYAFASAAGQGGNLQVAWRTLPLDATTQSISLHTRWQAGGAGRADVEVIAPTLQVPYDESECWLGATQSYALAYDSNPLTGSESLCAFTPAATLPFPDPFPPL